MNLVENIFLVSACIGILISLALLSRVLTEKKADFFLGLVVLMLALELLFSWGAQSGFNNNPGIFPYWTLLNYLIIPPSIWIFVKYNTDDNFRLRPWHIFLFIPAIVAYVMDLWSNSSSVSLMNYNLWVWFSQYLPLLGLIYVLVYFWIKFFKVNFLNGVKSNKNRILPQLRFLMLMICLSIISSLWLTFEIIGFEHFEYIEYTFVFLFLGLAFFNFLESQTFPAIEVKERNKEFPNYNDEENLILLEKTLKNERLYLKPNLPLKELALELQLPLRYVSFLINHYHKKNYKEYINQYRIDAFLEKVKSGENDLKTLLGIALDSGFSSKSTFNQVFKNHMGKSPSDYLNLRKTQ